ncbi:unnamed protein product [Cuscuta campestris]|uniref:Uncharacterized protein n=1 Tax=Cuscuta campestris TaxID=132261 RepID=A0A484KZY5_9ASTE|nr:unnamed protein product [Cuscuta campestris]
MGARSIMDENEMARVVKRFGDEQSTLLDQYERLTFEVQLNRAILGRSFSDRTYGAAPPRVAAPPAEKGKRPRPFSGLPKAVKRLLLKPFLAKRKNKKGSIIGGDQKEPTLWKAFGSRSLRF